MFKKLMVLTSLVAACHLGTIAPASAQEQQPDFGKMFQALMGGAAQDGDTPAAEPINFRELKKLLPKELEGMKRVEASGEKTAAMGMTVSTAKGVYRNDEGGEITIELSDLGGSGFAGLAAMGFAAAEIDRETEHGYERTTKFDGHPGKEEFDNQLKRGEVSAFVAKRVSAKATSYKVSDEALHEAFETIDLKKLSELATKAEDKAEAPAEEKAE
jgi:hypothetical protein